MRSTLLFSVLASATLSVALSAATASSALAMEAAASPLRADFSAMALSNAATQKEMQKVIRAAIAKNCVSLGSDDRIAVEKDAVESMEALANSGQVVIVEKASCDDLDLPCSAPRERIINQQHLVSSLLKIRRSGSRGSYEIVARTSWDYDLPVPMANVVLTGSAQCRAGWTGPQDD